MYGRKPKLTNNANLIASYYEVHVGELRGYIDSRVGDMDVAKDLVQTVFERLLKSDKMITEVTLPALVYTIARNLVNDYWRHRRAVEEYEHVVTMRPAGGNGMMEPETVYSVNETIRLLEQGMARLTESQRRVYTLNIYRGMKVGEISRTLNMKYKSVENCLGVARKQIRSYMRSRLAV